MSETNQSPFSSFADDIFGSQTELDSLAERGGHDEETVLGLFRRLREARAGERSAVRGGNPTSLRDHLVMVHAPLVEHCARNFKASASRSMIWCRKVTSVDQSGRPFRSRKANQVFDLCLSSHRGRNSALPARFGAFDSRTGLAF